MNYTLYKNKYDPKILYPTDTWYSDEYCRDHCRMYLSTEYVEDDWSHKLHKYYSSILRNRTPSICRWDMKFSARNAKGTKCGRWAEALTHMIWVCTTARNATKAETTYNHEAPVIPGFLI